MGLGRAISLTVVNMLLSCVVAFIISLLVVFLFNIHIPFLFTAVALSTYFVLEMDSAKKYKEWLEKNKK